MAKRHLLRHFLIDNVNLGDGERVSVWLVFSPKEVEVRRFGGHYRFRLPLSEFAGMVGRLAQVHGLSSGTIVRKERARGGCI